MRVPDPLALAMDGSPPPPSERIPLTAINLTLPCAAERDSAFDSMRTRGADGIGRQDDELQKKDTFFRRLMHGAAVGCIIKSNLAVFYLLVKRRK